MKSESVVAAIVWSAEIKGRHATLVRGAVALGICHRGVIMFRVEVSFGSRLKTRGEVGGIDGGHAS